MLAERDEDEKDDDLGDQISHHQCSTYSQFSNISAHVTARNLADKISNTEEHEELRYLAHADRYVFGGVEGVDNATERNIDGRCEHECCIHDNEV